ncbi:MAG: NAD(P)-dependent oxidoreductase [Oscillospiraceae bacterium]|jgi:UDP-glucose 4-epimerase|nr:NAD(P)-dependent oxidoreductase [Oscillospiraceae bacterium]
MEKILVTGASGLIGKRVCAGLLKKGYAVVAAGTSFPKHFEDAENFKFTCADPGDEAAWNELFEQEHFDGLVHLACSADNDFGNIIETNEMEISAQYDSFIFKMARQARLKHCILLSTTQVYENPKTREPVNEENNVKPISNYAVLKRNSELQMAADLKGAGDILSCIIRTAPVYTHQFCDNLYAKIHDPKDDSNFVYRTGEYGFHFCCVHNLVDFVICILKQVDAYTYTGVYNVADKYPISASEIIEFMTEFHDLGAVFQREEPLAKGTFSFLFARIGKPVEECKNDYRHLNLDTILSNLNFCIAKASRICPFSWNLENTK